MECFVSGLPCQRLPDLNMKWGVTMDTNAPLISIITPVYQVNPYLAEFFDSISAQSCDNFELILIDDGSTVGSLEACKTFAKSAAYVRHIDQGRKGVSPTRNRGIKAA